MFNSLFFQGQTVAKPNTLVVDIQSSFQAGMVYVMLSRVCCLIQLIILEKLNSEKIKACPKVISENKRMESVSVNKNPSPWNKASVRGTRVSSLNVRSLKKHIEDVRMDPVLLKSDMICVQETWIEEEDDENNYQLDGFQAHFNSQGRGKGLVIYMKENTFVHVKDFRTSSLQMSKMSSKVLDVIIVYRSQEESFSSVTIQVKKLIDPNTTTLIVGDLNFCYFAKQNEFSNFLVKFKFEQLVKTATHIEGAILDHAYFKREGDGDLALVELFANYYSDHDTVTVLVP